MKAKLIKRGENNYKLYVNEATFATTDNSPYKRLSLKNCQAIENGYDLDELALEAFELDLNCQGDCNNYYERFAFKLGFQKALEILGDKKFSESDVREAIDVAWHDDNIDKSTIIQSLQPTEWDVIIETECVMGCQNLLLNGENSVCCGDKKPKLDANNCLILKVK